MWTDVRATKHYLREHSHEVEWERVLEIVFTTKWRRLKRDRVKFVRRTKGEEITIFARYDRRRNVLLGHQRPSASKAAQEKMICEECGRPMEWVEVRVEGAKTKSWAWRCLPCLNFKFDQASSQEVIKELRLKRQHLMKAKGSKRRLHPVLKEIPLPVRVLGKALSQQSIEPIEDYLDWLWEKDNDRCCEILCALTEYL